MKYTVESGNSVILWSLQIEFSQFRISESDFDDEWIFAEIIMAQEPPTDAVQKSVEELKSLGNAAFKAGEWQRAIELYSQALNLSPDAHQILANRSAAFLRQGLLDDAVRDAELCILKAPLWAKGYMRKAVALLEAKDPGETKTGVNLQRALSAACVARSLDPSLAEDKAFAKLFTDKEASLESVTLPLSAGFCFPHESTPDDSLSELDRAITHSNTFAKSVTIVLRPGQYFVSEGQIVKTTRMIGVGQGEAKINLKPKRHDQIFTLNVINTNCHLESIHVSTTQECALQVSGGTVFAVDCFFASDAPLHYPAVRVVTKPSTFFAAGLVIQFVRTVAMMGLVLPPVPSSLRMFRCQLSRGKAGGGLQVYDDGHCVAERCRFEENNVGVEVLKGGSVLLSHCQLSNNTRQGHLLPIILSLGVHLLS